jgi:hypothetical protein
VSQFGRAAKPWTAKIDIDIVSNAAILDDEDAVG